MPSNTVNFIRAFYASFLDHKCKEIGRLLVSQANQNANHWHKSTELIGLYARCALPWSTWRSATLMDIYGHRDPSALTLATPESVLNAIKPTPFWH
jgi:hypothetical protein